MRRVWWVAVVLCVPVAIGLVLLAAELQRPMEWRVRADQHVVWLAEHAGRQWTVHGAAAAHRPSAFDADMSIKVYGDSGYYQTDVSYEGKNVGPRPLPYPPRELWCVWLEPAGVADGAARVVFVALHQDLYGGDWLLHDAPGPALSTECQAILEAVGCDLGA
jgi:hypothetical protein